MCFDKRVIAGLAVVGLALVLFAPGVLAVALPVLVLAACPLSMLFMMRAMSRSGSASGASSSTTAGRAEPAPTVDGEVAELRAELERLRAEHVLRTRRVPAGPPDGTTAESR